MKKIEKEKNNSLSFIPFWLFSLVMKILETACFTKRNNYESQFMSCSSKESNLLIMKIAYMNYNPALY